jgi:hypothetical protein
MDNRIMGMLLREVARLHLQMQRTSIACCGGTTSTQCFILTELGRSGTPTPAEIGRVTSIRVGQAAPLHHGPHDSNKMPSDTDRRTINISLSPAGEERYAELNQALNEHSGRVMRWIPDADQPMVHGALRLLSEALKAEAASVPATDKQEGSCNVGTEISCCEPC